MIQSKPILEGFVWSHQSKLVLVSYLLTSLHQQADCWQGGFFHVVLSEYPNQSHNFTNLNFCHLTLLFSKGRS